MQASSIGVDGPGFNLTPVQIVAAALLADEVEEAAAAMTEAHAALCCAPWGTLSAEELWLLAVDVGAAICYSVPGVKETLRDLIRIAEARNAAGRGRQAADVASAAVVAGRARSSRRGGQRR